MKIRPALLPHQVLFIAKDLFLIHAQLKKSPRPAIWPQWINWLSNTKPYTERALQQSLLSSSVCAAEWMGRFCKFCHYYKQGYWCECSSIHESPFYLLSWGGCGDSVPRILLWVCMYLQDDQSCSSLCLSTALMAPVSSFFSWTLSLVDSPHFPFGKTRGIALSTKPEQIFLPSLKANLPLKWLLLQSTLIIINHLLIWK